MQLGHIDFLDTQIEALNKAIEQYVTALSQEEAAGGTSMPPNGANAEPASSPLTFTQAV